MPIKTTS